MRDQILKDLKNEVKFGYLKKKHPFRYACMASIEGEMPVQRTVVLRDTTEDFDLIIYTDERSDKIDQLKVNPNSSLLFYNPKNRIQVKIEGNAKLITSGEEYETYWNKVQGTSKKDFTTKHAPGTPIDQPDDVEYNEEEHHFCLIKIVPEHMEYLQLNRPHHIRVKFEKANQWKGQFLNP